MDTQRVEEKDKFISLSKSLFYAFPKTIPISQHIKWFEKCWKQTVIIYSGEMQSISNFAFWMSYLNMTDLFLNFVRTPWIGDWTLHFQSAAEIVPWYCTYDHLNNVKYLPVYIYEMLTIPNTRLSIAEHLVAGDFVV